MEAKTEACETLGRKELAAFRGGTLSCASGSVWVTWPNGGDRILHGGQSLVLPDGARALAQAVGSGGATVGLLPADPARRRRRR